MNINLEDYLSEDQIRSIIEEEVREDVRHQIMSMSDGHLSDIMVNATYEAVDRMVAERFHENLTEKLAIRVAALIDTMSFFTIFRQKDAYGPASLCQQYLDEAVEANKDLITQKVVEKINDFHYDEIIESIEDTVYEVIHDKLFGKKEDDHESF